MKFRGQRVDNKEFVWTGSIKHTEGGLTGEAVSGW